MAFVNCPECDTTISSKAISCPHCGVPIAQEPTQEPAQQPAQQAPPVNKPNPVTDPPPKTWLVESILATILCCIPFGIVAIVYATRVESNWYVGNKELALSSSKSAKSWTLVSVFIGLGISLIYIILMSLGIVAGLFSGAAYL